jgi:hypothetical protein
MRNYKWRGTMNFALYNQDRYHVPCDCCEDDCIKEARFATETPIVVCKDCMLYLNDIPEYFGTLLEDYISGNVL